MIVFRSRGSSSPSRFGAASRRRARNSSGRAGSCPCILRVVRCRGFCISRGETACSFSWSKGRGMALPRSVSMRDQTTWACRRPFFSWKTTRHGCPVSFSFFSTASKAVWNCSIETDACSGGLSCSCTGLPCSGSPWPRPRSRSARRVMPCAASPRMSCSSMMSLSCWFCKWAARRLAPGHFLKGT